MQDVITDSFSSGGWTQVLNVTSKTADFSTFVADSLEYIDKLNGFKADKKYGMKSSALKVLRNVTGYKQFRFKCKKNNGNNMIHIKTKEDSNGYNVVESLTISSSNSIFTIPSCGTYERLPDDKSELGYHCGDWSWTNAHGKEKVLLDHLMYIASTVHWNIGHAQNRYECDDFVRNQPYISTGDAWEVYVR